jgi:hypothetical protein
MAVELAPMDGRPETALHRGERNALRVLARFDEPEAPSKFHRISVESMRSLVTKGLVLEGPAGIFGPTFKLSAAGRQIAEELATMRQLALSAL